MTYVDDRGRLFGRLNLVDAAVGAILLLLIPLAYATYLLFKPATPRIDSVAPSVISKEEQRISAGSRLIAKFKVKGEGFTPLLRARIDDTDALGFVFESPNSADVLVGPTAVGPHDLVLLDGVQEVARARGAITTQASSSIEIRAVGRLTNLNAALADAIKVGTALPADAPAYRVLALGPLVPGHRQISLAGSTIEIPVANTRARAAVLTLACDATLADNPCTIGDRPETRSGAVTIALPGPGGFFDFTIEELLPAAAPVKAMIRIRQPLGLAAPVRQGDRDTLLDERAAVVSAIAGDIITLDAGVDRDHDGWRYRGQRLIPGGRFRFVTDRYEINGMVQSVDVKAPQP